MRNEALHAAVLAAPDDDTPRQIYADWLLARGDPRGELIAVQLERARARDPQRQRELADRERELWQTHGEVWRPVEGPHVEFERGFIELIWAAGGEFVEHLDGLLDWACVRTLRAQGGRGIDLPRFLKARLGRMVLRVLALSFIDLPLPSLAELLSSPRLSTLERLSIDNSALTSWHFAALRSPTLSRVTSLFLQQASLDAESVAELAHWPHPRTLEYLALLRNELGPGAIQAIADTEALEAVKELLLGNTGIGPQDIQAVIAAELPLVTLEIYNNLLDTRTAEVIANAPHLRSLRRLNLSNTAIGPEGVEALLASPYLDRELELVIDGDVLGLEPEVHDDQGKIVRVLWPGEPPPEVSARFRVILEHYP